MITLPLDMAEMVDAKVASGAYADESDVVRDGLSRLQDRDLRTEAWLRTEVAGTYDAHMRDPSRAVRADIVLAQLERRFTDDSDMNERGA